MGILSGFKTKGKIDGLNTKEYASSDQGIVRLDSGIGNNVNRNQSVVGDINKRGLLEDEFKEFEPVEIPPFQFRNFRFIQSCQLNGYILAVGCYESSEELKIASGDTKTDYGFRLMQFRKDGTLIKQFPGSLDSFSYSPYFFVSPDSTQYILLCHRGFEYDFGADIYYIRQEKISYLGELDIEPGYFNEFGENDCRYRRGVIDIVRIQQKDRKIEFSFRADTLLISPGAKDSVVYNNNIRYSFDFP